MNRQDERLLILRDWVQKADHDLSMAVAGLGLEEDPPTEGICFHAQQVIEKYLKALLVADSLDVPKTHDIGKLLQILSAGQEPPLSNDEQRRLTDYATVTRYPGDFEAIPLSEARRAVALARRVRAWARRQLPQRALRKKRKRQTGGETA